MWEIHICHESDPFSALPLCKARYVVGAMLRRFEPSKRGRVWIGMAKGTLSHGVSVNRANNERE